MAHLSSHRLRLRLDSTTLRHFAARRGLLLGICLLFATLGMSVRCEAQLIGAGSVQVGNDSGTYGVYLDPALSPPSIFVRLWLTNRIINLNIDSIDETAIQMTYWEYDSGGHHFTLSGGADQPQHWTRRAAGGVALSVASMTGAVPLVDGAASGMLQRQFEPSGRTEWRPVQRQPVEITFTPYPGFVGQAGAVNQALANMQVAGLPGGGGGVPPPGRPPPPPHPPPVSGPGDAAEGWYVYLITNYGSAPGGYLTIGRAAYRTNPPLLSSFPGGGTDRQQLAQPQPLGGPYSSQEEAARSLCGTITRFFRPRLARFVLMAEMRGERYGINPEFQRVCEGSR